MCKLSVKCLVILTLVSVVIFTFIAFSVETRAGWAMCLVIVAILCAAWSGVFVKAFFGSLLALVSWKGTEPDARLCYQDGVIVAG